MRDQVELLEHEADRVAAQSRARRVVELADVLARDADRARRRQVEHSRAGPSIVDLPEPDGPTIDMKSPGKICSETSRSA